MLEAFAKNGADVNFQDNNGQTPIHYAAASGNYSNFPIMQTVLQFNSWNDLGKDSSINILVKYGAHIGSKDKSGLTPHDIATKKGTYSMF